MRVIDADKMRENLMWCKEQSGSSDSFWDDVIERLDVQPTVDAVPVRRGRWTTHRTMQHDGEWYCDQCGYEPCVFENTPYCPNCGADMREGEKE